MMKNRNKILGIAGVSLTVALTSVFFISNMEVEGSGQSTNAIDHTDLNRSIFNTSTTQTIHSSATEASQDTRYSGPADDSNRVKQLSNAQYQQYSTYGELPASLKGSSIPPLYVDANGQLIQDTSTKFFMEYFLSAARESSTSEILARTQEYFTLVLDEPALSQAYELLDNYMQYRYQLDLVASRDNLQVSPENKAAAVKATLDARKALRRETLGNEVAQAMFGDSEKYEDYVVNMMQTSERTDLSEDEKRQAYLSHEKTLPEAIKKRVQYNRQVQELEDKIAELKQQDGNADQIYELRKDFYGEKSAKMWAFIEEDSGDWQARVAAFNYGREQILTSVMLNEEQKRQQIDALRERDFNENERLKLAWQGLQ